MIQGLSGRDGRALLAALTEAVDGRRKLIAAEIWPGMRVESAASRLKRVLDGELAVPAALIDTILANPGHEPLTAHFQRVTQPDPADLARRLLDLYGRIEQQLAQGESLIEGLAALEPQVRRMRTVRADHDRRAAG
ncbi:MAG: hypothetical protein AAF517_12825 [Planctomycetota bacterium]